MTRPVSLTATALSALSLLFCTTALAWDSEDRGRVPLLEPVFGPEGAPPAEPVPGPRGVFASAQVGVAVPLTGPLFDHRALGAELGAAGGLWLFPGVAGFVEVIGAHHRTGAGWSYTTFAVGVGARGVLAPEMALHPFGEAGILLQLVSNSSGDAPQLDGSTPTIGLTMSVGLELDVSSALSLEVGIRPEFVFASGTWPDTETGGGHMFLLTPFAGGTLHL